MKNYNINASKNLKIIVLAFVFLLNTGVFATDENIWAKPLNRCWEFPKPDGQSFVFASDNALNNSAILFSSNTIININLEGGSIIWKTDTGSKILSKPFLFEERIYFLSNTVENKESAKPAQLFLNSVDLKSGLIILKKVLPSGTQNNIAFFKEKLFLFIENKKILSVFLETAEINWFRVFNEEILEISPDESRIFLLTASNKILHLSSADGRLIEEIKSPTKISILKNIDNSELIWADDKGSITSYNLKNRKVVWSRKIGGKITSITNYKDTLYISSLDNFIYFFDRYNGKILLRKRLDGRIINNPSIKENILAVSAYNSPTISVFDIKTRMIINKVSLSDANTFVESFGFSAKRLVVTTPGSISAFSFEC